MKIGIAAATSFEIQPAIDFLSKKNIQPFKHEFEILITGIGLMASTYQLTNFIKTKSPAYLVQAGIGGSFNINFQPGSTFIIRDEVMGDMGVEENNSFKDLFDMGLIQPGATPYTNDRLLNPYIADWKQAGLPIARGITLSEITTNKKRIELLREKYNCDIESMEGAALHYVCLQQSIPFVQIRSVSNFVGERDKSRWKLKESVINLNLELIRIIQQLP